MISISNLSSIVDISNFAALDAERLSVFVWLAPAFADIRVNLTTRFFLQLQHQIYSELLS